MIRTRTGIGSDATASGGGETNGNTTFTASTGASGVMLTIGLNQTQSTLADSVNVVLTDTANSSDTQTILVVYQQDDSCGNNTGSVNNGTLSITPGSVALNSTQLSQVLAIYNLTGNPLHLHGGPNRVPVRRELVLPRTSPPTVSSRPPVRVQ